MHFHAGWLRALICLDLELITVYERRHLKPRKPTAPNARKAPTQYVKNNRRRVVLECNEGCKEIAFGNLFQARNIIQSNEAHVFDRPKTHILCCDRKMTIRDINSNNPTSLFRKMGRQTPDAAAELDDIAHIAHDKARPRKIGFHDRNIIGASGIETGAGRIIQNLRAERFISQHRPVCIDTSKSTPNFGRPRKDQIQMFLTHIKIDRIRRCRLEMAELTYWARWLLLRPPHICKNTIQ